MSSVCSNEEYKSAPGAKRQVQEEKLCLKASLGILKAIIILSLETKLHLTVRVRVEAIANHSQAERCTC